MLEGLRLIDGNQSNIIYDKNGNVEKGSFTYDYKKTFVVKIITRFGIPVISFLPRNLHSPTAEIIVRDGNINVRFTHAEYETQIKSDDIHEYYQNACILKELTDYMEEHLYEMIKGEL